MEMRICSVDGCDRPHDAKGFCKCHFKRWRQYGTPLGSAQRPDILPRLVRKEPSTIHVEGSVAFVELTRGKTAIIDASDVPLVEGRFWRAHLAKNDDFYAHANAMDGDKRQVIIMHRLIMGVSSGIFVDHRDCNTLNNRRSNLRIATHSQNQQNRRRRIGGTKTGFKGVSIDERCAINPFKANIKVGGRTIHLGGFPSAEEAHAAYCHAATEHFGEFARFA